MIVSSWRAPELDAASRSMALLTRLLSVLPRRPRLILLGGGSDALLLDAAPQIGRPQVWRVLDPDAQEVSDALERVAEAAERRGHTVTYPGSALLIHTGYGAVRVEGEQMCRHPPRPRDLGEADALLCERLLHRLPRAWLDALCRAWRGPLLATLTACGPAQLVPTRPADRHVMRALAHMPDDATWNGHAAKRAACLLAERGFRVQRARAEWRLGPAQLAAMRDWLLAVEAALERHGDACRLAAWRAERTRQALAGRLRMRMPHTDLLALPR
jgi:hypothetical protein